MSGQPQGTGCPLCGTQARIVTASGTQAFCFEIDCNVFTWDPMTRQEIAGGMKLIDLSCLEGEGW